MTGETLKRPWTGLSSISFQVVDQSDGDRASPPGEKHPLHEEREERLKTIHVKSAREKENNWWSLAVSICHSANLR